ncbi:hypothetical protein L0F63_002376, partial [Massospora cicadina]
MSCQPLVTRAVDFEKLPQPTPLGQVIMLRQGIATPNDLRTSTPFLTFNHTAIHAKPICQMRSPLNQKSQEP